MEDSRKKAIIDLLPDDYKKELVNIYNIALSIFKDNLINITLGGSGGKGTIIDGWSDLDLYIVLNDYDPFTIKEFMNIVSNNNIHTGTTFYTINELENNFIDLKTKVMLYERQTFDVNPTLYGKEVYNEIDYEEIKESDRVNFPCVLHDIRRRFIELCMGKDLDKTYIKKLLVLVKCILRSYDIFTYGYNNTFNELFIFLEKHNIDITSIKDFDIIMVINNLETSKEKVVIFSNFILNYISKIYNKGELKWKKELVLER